MKEKTHQKFEVPTTDLICRGKSVLVKQVSLEAKAKSGIIIAETTKEKKPTGILVAVGPDCKDDLKEGIGRLVYYNAYANLTAIDGNNNTLMMLDDQAIYYFISESTILMDDTDIKTARIDIDNSGN